MIDDFPDYNLYLQFIETYSPGGFKTIDRNAPLIKEIENFSELHNQFFIVADLIQAQIIWSSKRSTQMIGIKPKKLDASHFMEATHPEDLKKHTLGRSKMWNVAHELYLAREGKMLLSTDIRIRNFHGEFTNTLFQLYFFYSEQYKTVFLFLLLTNIDGFKRKKHGYHYYVGDDFSNFRYPDEELLMVGTPFTGREFEIIKLIELGLNSKQIAEKLFVSVYTINTHRANILKKTDCNNISDLIYSLEKNKLL